MKPIFTWRQDWLEVSCPKASGERGSAQPRRADERVPVGATRGNLFRRRPVRWDVAHSRALPRLLPPVASMTFLFATGVENSYPTLADGRRVDQMDRCGHYARWEEDFALVRELGLRALHYGPAYYRAHVAPDHYEWDSCDEQMHRLRQLGIEVIADLCHFGVPTWLGGFQDPAFPVLFAEYARAFAQRYPWVRYYTPIHEISLCASRSALRGWWNECEAG